MNKTFTIIDRNNNIQKVATGIVKFNQEGKDYVIYCVDENAENKQIFVSRLVLNSEGRYFIDNILPEEKQKLSEIVYNIIILTPTNYKKGESSETLLKGLTEKYKLTLSNDIPALNEQEYYNNCSIAITSKELVALAEEFFSTNLQTVAPAVEEPKQAIPTWEISSVSANQASIASGNVQHVGMTQENNVMQNSVQVEQPTVSAIPANPEPIKPAEPIVPNLQINNEPVVEPLVQPTTQSVEPKQPMQQPEVSNIGINQVGINEPQPNPQAEKLAVVSDPSLASITGQPNVARLNNKGKASVKYIVIGTVCILLAIAVVIVAYILIQKKTTGV